MRTLKLKFRHSQDTAYRPTLITKTTVNTEITIFSTTFKTAGVTLEYNTKPQNKDRLSMSWLIQVTAGKF